MERTTANQTRKEQHGTDQKREDKEPEHAPQEERKEDQVPEKDPGPKVGNARPAVDKVGDKGILVFHNAVNKVR